MATPYIAEIKIISWNYAPKGWAFCNGQLLPIGQNQALFSLVGTTYGGDGQTTFGLPNLQGRIPLHLGNGFTIGEQSGEVTHTITSTEMPAHNHGVQASTAAPNSPNPYAAGVGNYLAAPTSPIYDAAANLTALAPSTISAVGASQAHENEQPYTVLNFCIALQGIFPTRS
jgi:microcystin-dependent protein